MADQNTYLRYKQETQSLIYWLMHASNSIIQSLSNDTEPDNKPSTLSLNNTGKIKVSQFVPISTLIAANINPIPSTIYRLFHSVIEARKQHMRFFNNLLQNNLMLKLRKVMHHTRRSLMHLQKLSIF